MKTWSSVKKYYSENKHDPLDLVKPEVSALCGDEFDKKQVTWNINMCAGVIKQYKTVVDPPTDNRYLPNRGQYQVVTNFFGSPFI